MDKDPSASSGSVVPPSSRLPLAGSRLIDPARLRGVAGAGRQHGPAIRGRRFPWIAAKSSGLDPKGVISQDWFQKGKNSSDLGGHAGFGDRFQGCWWTSENIRARSRRSSDGVMATGWGRLAALPGRISDVLFCGRVRRQLFFGFGAHVLS